MHRMIALLVVFVSVATAAQVRALSCGTPFGFEALPAEGAAVPRNTRVWLGSWGGRPDTRYRWQDSDGVAVPFRETRIPVGTGPTLIVLTPEEPLRFPATYQVDACFQDRGSETCLPRTTFSTLDEVDEEPPAPPEAEEWMRSAGESDFGNHRLVYFKVRGDALVLADTNGGGLDSPLDDEGAELAVLTSLPDVDIGYGPCTQRNIKGDRADVRFGTFDLAGNFSGFTEPQSVKLPELDGCALATRRDGGWMALLGLIALMHRHRRVRRHARA